VSDNGLPSDDRTIELLVLRAAEGLSVEGERALGDWGDCDAMDEAAAVLAVGLACDGGLEPMPASVHDAMDGIIRRGWESEAGEPAADHDHAPIARIEPKPVTTNGAGDRGRLSLLGIGGWLATAACLALFVIAQSPDRVATVSERLAVLESKPGIVRTAWLGLDDAGLGEAPHAYDSELTGEVVWDPETNEGYMVFEGLEENDPGLLQYQLWIFDADRPTGQLPRFGEGILSQRPVDGGVFDSVAGRVIVPIDAKLPVGKAAVFAITVEAPGGVVVSDRDIVTLALVD